MNAAVGLTAGLGLDGDRCIRVIPRQIYLSATVEQASKLWKHIEPHLKKALNTVYLREVSRLVIDSIIFKRWDPLTGFPPIREFRETRENFEDFFQSGKSGKKGGFQPKSGKKFQIRELFSQTIFKPIKPINLRKMFFTTVKPQQLSGNCNICID